MGEHRKNPAANPSSIEVRNSSAQMLEIYERMVAERGNNTQEEIIADILDADTLNEIVDTGMVFSVDRDSALRDIPFRLQGFTPFVGDKVDRETQKPTIFLTFECEALEDIDPLFIKKGDRVLVNDGGKVVLAQALKLYEGKHFPITLMFHASTTSEENEVHRLVRPRPKMRVSVGEGTEVSA